MEYGLVFITSFVCAFLMLLYAKKVLVCMDVNKYTITTKKMCLMAFLHACVFCLLFWIQKDIEDILYHTILSSMILAMAFIDKKERAIPTLSLLVMGVYVLIMALFEPSVHIWERALSSFIGCFPLLLVSLLYKGSVGSGDIYFLSILGYSLGSIGIGFVEMIAYVCASFYACILYMHKKAGRKTEIAMIPFFYTGYLFYLYLYFSPIFLF